MPILSQDNPLLRERNFLMPARKWKKEGFVGGVTGKGALLFGDQVLRSVAIKTY